MRWPGRRNRPPPSRDPALVTLTNRGIIPSLCTPCLEDGEVDLPSQKRLVEFVIENGVDGVAALLGNGEYFKFTDEERMAIIDETIDAANGRVPVYVGTSAPSTEAMVKAGRYAADAGAQCIVVLPPFFSNIVPTPDEIMRHLQAASSGVGIPVMLQDARPFGVRMSPAGMINVATSCPKLSSVKIEGDGSLARVKATARLAKGRIAVFGGRGGLELAAELDAGADGNIPGCATPEIWVDVFKAFESQGSKKALSVQAPYQQYLDFAFTGEHGHSYLLEKLALKMRGVIRSEYVRAPRGRIEKSASGKLHKMLEELELL
jgi:2-keto-3-deoxy-L-arabinonate dehydratase